MNSIKLGMYYKDMVTGFEGTATGLVKYITGCNQVLLVPKVDNEGKCRESHWFDVQRVKEIDIHSKIEIDNSTNNGPDMEAPKK
jgi:hypothetical protein